MTANVHSIVKLARGNARERALYASNTPPPSQLNGRNIGGLTWRMRRVGRLSPKQFRNLARRRVLTLPCDGILRYRNHVEQVEHVELSACSYMICMVNQVWKIRKVQEQWCAKQSSAELTE